MIYNLYYTFYSILDLILFKFTTAEIKNDGFRLIYKSLIILSLFFYMVWESIPRWKLAVLFFYICLSNIFFGYVSSEEGNKSKNKRNGTTSS